MTDDTSDDADAQLSDHSIRLRDIATPDDPRCPDDMTRGCLVASYDAAHRPNATYTEARTVSVRLPVECLALFEDGHIPVADLTAEERDWLQAASAAHGNEIDFEATDTAEVAL